MRHHAARVTDPPTGPAALDVRLEVADGTATLQLTGPFTAATAGRVRAALQLVSVARARVVVDLARVTGVDDAALDLLASARRAARSEGWELSLLGATSRGGAAQPPGAAGSAGDAPSRTMVTNRTSKPARS